MIEYWECQHVEDHSSQEVTIIEEESEQFPVDKIEVVEEPAVPEQLVDQPETNEKKSETENEITALSQDK